MCRIQEIHHNLDGLQSFIVNFTGFMVISVYVAEMTKIRSVTQFYRHMMFIRCFDKRTI